ncbi:hypothetical protein C7475_102623 [Chitinophaga sp. S165]|nr:hypothetical protein C7475_102623 [Chitinophaga sp. S165]
MLFIVVKHTEELYKYYMFRPDSFYKHVPYVDPPLANHNIPNE